VFQLGCTIHNFHKLIRGKIGNSLESIKWERTATLEEANCHLPVDGAGTDSITKLLARLRTVR
jgi:hypothetical protein